MNFVIMNHIVTICDAVLQGLFKEEPLLRLADLAKKHGPLLESGLWKCWEIDWVKFWKIYKLIAVQ